MFNLAQNSQKRLREDEVIDGAYSCTQPLVDCGYVSNEVIWAQTSVNTVEFVRVADAICFLRVEQVSLAFTDFFSSLTTLVT